MDRARAFADTGSQWLMRLPVQTAGWPHSKYGCTGTKPLFMCPCLTHPLGHACPVVLLVRNLCCTVQCGHQCSLIGVTDAHRPPTCKGDVDIHLRSFTVSCFRHASDLSKQTMPVCGAVPMDKHIAARFAGSDGEGHVGVRSPSNNSHRQ